MRALALVTVAAPLTVLLFASQALALGVCDPDGHFCLQLDATSARVCDVMQRGALDPATCTAEDAELRDGMTRVGMPPMRALRLRGKCSRATHCTWSAFRASPVRTSPRLRTAPSSPSTRCRRGARCARGRQ